MSYNTPRLTNGQSAGQSIYVWGSTQQHDLGTRGIMPDGRVFYYSANRGSAIDAGVLVQGNQISVDFDDLATNTAVKGDLTVNVTPVGSATYTANQLAGGFLSINSGTTGAGRQYKIMSHPATTAATAFDITLWDPIADEDFNANTTATVVPNPYSSVALLDVSASRWAVGATTVDVPAGSTTVQYGWIQTWGVATVLADVAGDIVGHLIVGGAAAGTDGSFIGLVDAAADIDHVVGVNLFTTVADDYQPVILTIMP